MNEHELSDNEEMATSKGELIVYQSEDGDVKLEVRLEDESVWLTQPLMARLFHTTQQNISQHILNIYEEGELTPEATHKKFLSVRQEGDRQIRRLLDHYNLDMIISVAERSSIPFRTFSLEFFWLQERPMRISTFESSSTARPACPVKPHFFCFTGAAPEDRNGVIDISRYLIPRHEALFLFRFFREARLP